MSSKIYKKMSRKVKSFQVKHIDDKASVQKFIGVRLLIIWFLSGFLMGRKVEGVQQGSRCSVGEQ